MSKRLSVGWLHTPLMRDIPVCARMLVGVLARLCSHLLKDDRSHDPSTRSKPDVRHTVYRMSNESRTLDILTDYRRLVPRSPRDPQCLTRHPSPFSLSQEHTSSRNQSSAPHNLFTNACRRRQDSTTKNLRSPCNQLNLNLYALSYTFIAVRAL